MQNRRTLRTFYILILTQTFSLIGSEMTGLAIAIKVFKDTSQATPLALTMFFAALPSLVSASIAGVLADRWDRRYVMMLADAGQAVGTLLLLISFATGAFELWHLYTVSLIQAVFAIFQRPAFSASVTMLVPDDHRDRANAIRELTSPTATIFAQVIAGLLFAVIGVVGVMAIDLFTFLVAVTVVAMIHIPRPVQSAEGRAAQHGSLWKESLVGFKFMRERPAMLYMVMYTSLLNFLLSLSMALNAAYILGLTDNGAVLGTINGMFGIGALAGGIIMSVWGGTRPRIHTIMPGIFVVGIGLALYGLSRNPLTLGISIIIMALPLPMVNASFSSILQLKVPPDLQGRVFASLGQISQLLMPLAYLLAGPLADQVFEPAVGGSHWGIVAPLVGSQIGSGIGLIMFIGGGLTMLATVIAYSMPMLRRMETLLPDYAPVVDEEDAQEEPVQTPEPALA